MNKEVLDRLKEEKKMLDDKIKKLNNFLTMTIVNDADAIQRELLGIQYHCMISYSNVLQLRIKEA